MKFRLNNDFLYITISILGFIYFSFYSLFSYLEANVVLPISIFVAWFIFQLEKKDMVLSILPILLSSLAYTDTLVGFSITILSIFTLYLLCKLTEKGSINFHDIIAIIGLLIVHLNFNMGHWNFEYLMLPLLIIVFSKWPMVGSGDNYKFNLGFAFILSLICVYNNVSSQVIGIILLIISFLNLFNSKNISSCVPAVLAIGFLDNSFWHIIPLLIAFCKYSRYSFIILPVFLSLYLPIDLQELNLEYATVLILLLEAYKFHKLDKNCVYRSSLLNFLAVILLVYFYYSKEITLVNLDTKLIVSSTSIFIALMIFFIALKFGGKREYIKLYKFNSNNYHFKSIPQFQNLPLANEEENKNIKILEIQYGTILIIGFLMLSSICWGLIWLF